MNDNRELDSKIIEEVHKPGREYLYQFSHVNYRNNFLKQRTWMEIAVSVDSTHVEVMKRWKKLRSRYVKLNKQLKSGSAALPRNSRDEWLMKSLDFLKGEIIDECKINIWIIVFTKLHCTSPTISNYETKSTEGILFQKFFDAVADELVEELDPETITVSETPTTSTATPTTAPSQLSNYIFIETVPGPSTSGTSTVQSQQSTYTLVEAIPGPSTSGTSTAPSVTPSQSSSQTPSQRSGRGHTPLKRRKDSEPLDPNIMAICRTITEQTQFLDKLASRESCLLYSFADTWASEFNKWPKLLQASYIYKMNISIDEENNKIKNKQIQ